MEEERDIMVPMRDGIHLAVNVFRPDTEGKFPALLALGAYGKELQECLIPPQSLYKSAVWDGNIEGGDTPEIVSRGYVHVIGDLRGTGASEGEYIAFLDDALSYRTNDVVETVVSEGLVVKGGATMLAQTDKHHFVQK